MKLEIISPEGSVFAEEAEQVAFPGTAGAFDVWPHHAPLIAALGEGVIRYRTKDGEQELSIAGGFVEVKNDILSVCIEQKREQNDTK